MPVECRHCPGGAMGFGGFRQHCPGLGDGIDLAFLALLRAEPRPVVERSPAIPFAIPGFTLDRGLDGGSMRSPAVGAAWIANVSEWSKERDSADQKPAEPDALARAALTDPVHTVVPIARTDERQAMLTGEVEALVEPAGAMLEQRRPLVRDHRLEKGIVLSVTKRRSLEKRHDLVQNGRIAGCRDIGRGSEGEPDPVVGNASAHALTRMR